MQRYTLVTHLPAVPKQVCGRIPLLSYPLRPHHLRISPRKTHHVTPLRRNYVAFSEHPEPYAGITPSLPASSHTSKSPFHFAAGYALFAKRPSRPFPSPFLSHPSHSFSEPLSTYNRARDLRREQRFQGELIRGVTNGDDAVLVSENLIVANDGVGAWAQRERGHAALWSRLVAHFWALEAERDGYGSGGQRPDLKAYLQRAFELTKAATGPPNEFFGTTTASGALLHSEHIGGSHRPVLYVAQLGDSQILVVRPGSEEVLFKTVEQWHWFDCPRQLGTNSPDTPETNAVTDRVDIEEGDVVLAMSDGVADNLWEHEVVSNVVESVKEVKMEKREKRGLEDMALGMRYVASELVKKARGIAMDPFAESPFMERAVDEGLPTEGGKLDDISVVAAMCKRKPGG